MSSARPGAVAVIFLSRRNGLDETGYAAAASAMAAAAARRPGYLGIDSARGSDGFGITVSWWTDEAAALAWRVDAAHAAVRERGRGEWYDGYEVVVAKVVRGYAWVRS